jgi:two-component system, cell cycle sensor histidine kinase and response regulator CckA
MSDSAGPTDPTVFPRGSWPTRYGVALLIVAAALGLKLAFLDHLSWSYPFVLLYAAVAVAAWAGGLGPSLVVTAIAGVAAGWFWMGQRYGFWLPRDQAIGLLLFMFEAVLIGLAFTRLRVAWAGADRSLNPPAASSTTRPQVDAAVLQIDEQAQQARRLEAVGQLAGGIAHDFNNLLTIILGNLDLILEHNAPADMHTALLNDVRAAGQRAAGLTRQLLAFSRREPVAPRRIDLNAVVTDMGSMLRRVIAEHIALQINLSPELGPILADQGQIEQVILNLAVNAKDAMPKGGTLTVRTAETEMFARDLPADAEGPPGRYVVLIVTDTGHGMDAATRARIFEPFFTTKEVGKGTGLGLATVYGNVKQAKGWVTVDSKPGAGSTFRVFLPRIEGPVEAEISPPAAEPRSRGSETILLVEQEPALRDLARRALEAAGYTVLSCPDGQAALEASRHYSGPIDLVVTDLVMPWMDGRHLGAALRVQRPDLPVLLMSGYSESLVANLSSPLPDEELLDKPFLPDDLTKKVRAILGQK